MRVDRFDWSSLRVGDPGGSSSSGKCTPPALEVEPGDREKIPVLKHLVIMAGTLLSALQTKMKKSRCTFKTWKQMLIHLGQQTHLDKYVSYWTTPLKRAYYNQPLTNVLLEMQVQASQMQLC